MANNKTKTLNNVIAHLKTACEASRSMLDACKSAAFEAKIQLDEKTECPQKRTDAVVALYADIYGKDHNVKANFKDALFLYALGDTPISFETRKGEEMHTTAEEAVQLSKHDMKKAVKEARDDLGLGRKSGGGRKPRTEKTAPVIKANPSQLVLEKKVQTKQYWETFAKGFHSDEWVEELKDALKAQGYRLTKIPAKK
jgi:hypothetical protein